MKKQFLIMLLFVTAVFNVTFGQKVITLFPFGNDKAISSGKLSGVDGSPYLFDDWRHGTIILKSGERIEKLLYRYNVSQNELHYLYNSEEYVVGNVATIKLLDLDGRTFIFDNIKVKNIDENNLFEVLADGKATLLVKYYIEITPSNFNQILNSGNPNETWSLKEKYCLKTGDTIIDIDKKGKSLMAILADKNVDLKKFVEQEKISFKTRVDIVKVVDYYNSL